MFRSSGYFIGQFTDTASINLKTFLKPWTKNELKHNNKM